MITKFTFSNFYSFVEKTEISFEVNKKSSSSFYDIKLDEDKRFNKVIAVMGPNGSGKTQLLRPLAFLSWFITHSIFSDPKEKIPFQTHKFHKNENSELEVFFNLNGKSYKYGLTMNENHVLHESLHVKTSSQYSYIFIRELKESGYAFKQRGFEFSKKLAESVRSNASVISAAYLHDVEIAVQVTQFFDKNIFNVNRNGRVSYNHSQMALFDCAQYFNENEDLNSKMLNIICDLDFGLTSVEFEEIFQKNDNNKPELLYLPIGIHRLPDGNEFKLPFFSESNGTQSAFVLLRSILPILKNGGVAIIDEIDNDLHPHMLPRILELFKFEDTNPHNAQIIFSCHTMEILSHLKKHQIYLVEKNNLVSESWRLDEITGLRSDDNIFAKYNSGSLGAVPNI